MASPNEKEKKRNIKKFAGNIFILELEQVWRQWLSKFLKNFYDSTFKKAVAILYQCHIHVFAQNSPVFWSTAKNVISVLTKVSQGKDAFAAKKYVLSDIINRRKVNVWVKVQKLIFAKLWKLNLENNITFISDKDFSKLEVAWFQTLTAEWMNYCLKSCLI